MKTIRYQTEKKCFPNTFLIYFFFIYKSGISLNCFPPLYPFICSVMSQGMLTYLLKYCVALPPWTPKIIIPKTMCGGILGLLNSEHRFFWKYVLNVDIIKFNCHHIKSDLGQPETYKKKKNNRTPVLITNIIEKKKKLLRMF